MQKRRRKRTRGLVYKTTSSSDGGEKTIFSPVNKWKDKEINNKQSLRLSTEGNLFRNGIETHCLLVAVWWCIKRYCGMTWLRPRHGNCVHTLFTCHWTNKRKKRWLSSFTVKERVVDGYTVDGCKRIHKSFGGFHELDALLHLGGQEQEWMRWDEVCFVGKYTDLCWCIR